MRECLELRIPEENAADYLPPGIGARLRSGLVRKVTVDTSDPLCAEICRLQRQFAAQGRFFFLGWSFHRHYSQIELAEAVLLSVFPSRTFEPAGEECGTVYDDSKACPECGSGAPQTGPLFLDGGSIPLGTDFACTIADELIVTSRVEAAFRDAGVTGVDFQPIFLKDSRAARSSAHLQMVVNGPFLTLDPATKLGDGPCGEEGYGRCSRGDLAGLNLLSQVAVRRDSLTSADVLATAQWVGVRRGLLRPRRLILFSQLAWQVAKRAHLRGLLVDVAHV